MKTLTALLTALTISNSSCATLLAQRQQDAIPSSIADYIQYVDSNHFRYAPADHPSYCASYSGQYLEKEKVGVCDEFAMNALLHLLDQKDIQNLFLVSYRGLRDIKSKDCDGKMTNESGHAIIVYETSKGTWRSLSNGKDEGVEATTLESVVYLSAENHQFTTLQRITAVPRTALQQQDVRIKILYAPPQENLNYFLGFLYKQYRIFPKS